MAKKSSKKKASEIQSILLRMREIFEQYPLCASSRPVVVDELVSLSQRLDVLGYNDEI